VDANRTITDFKINSHVKDKKGTAVTDRRYGYGGCEVEGRGSRVEGSTGSRRWYAARMAQRCPYQAQVFCDLRFLREKHFLHLYYNHDGSRISDKELRPLSPQVFIMRANFWSAVAERSVDTALAWR
jgi:hypothetical protein